MALYYKKMLAIWTQAIRVHQWLKNLLLFVPVFAAHQINNIESYRLLMLAFFSFSFCASAVYLINDFIDLEADNKHPRKKNRPLTSGAMPLWQGMVLISALLILSFFLGVKVNGAYFTCLLCYFGLTCLYSWYLKYLVLVDCLVLAALYTLRIIAGAAATQLSLSFWLLVFSIFLFLSLAFIKRCTELQLLVKDRANKIYGRGYYAADEPLIQTFGITSGYISVLILALYLNSNAVLKLYKTPTLVWPTVPLLLFWISWMWLKVHRQAMHDDPVIFAIKDKISICIGFIFVSFLTAATIKW